MHLRAAVIIATKGRPQNVASLLIALEQQSLRPEQIIVSACDSGDLPTTVGDHVNVIYGPAGTSVQRNRALTAIQGKAEVAFIFDDDFVPSKFWIERATAFLDTHPDIVCLTGRVILDGVVAGPLTWPDGKAVVDGDDLAAKPFSPDDCIIQENETPYACNMAYRVDKLADIRFDENLVQYGWLEDRDFGIRAAATGRIVWTDAVWGVHLGTRSGRASGVRFGYSQMVNPWYLMTKGVLTRSQAGQIIIRGLLSNTLGDILLKSAVDRKGRLRGNLIGIKDIIFGTWTPARIEKL